MINVTKVYLPDKEKYKAYVDEIYGNGWVTNNGPFVQNLEKRLTEYLNVRNVVLVSNGTVALELAYKLLGLKGSVVTTPFSFVATTSSLMMTGLEPVFADISSETFNIDPEKIEKSIKKDTSAILPVHVFGNACKVEEIRCIAEKYNLKVIYDAAHAFGIEYRKNSIFSCGDVSTASFHATKIFHTIEGGALITNNDYLANEARKMINFGIAKDVIEIVGGNAKMNEFEAAMGLCLMDDMDNIISARRIGCERYKTALRGHLTFQKWNPEATENYAYFPVLFENEAVLERTVKALNGNDIFPRRYFHPSLDSLKYITSKQYMPVSRDIASRILCLPLYAGLSAEDQDRIIDIVLSCIS